MKNLITLIFLLFSFSAFTQTANISGAVKDSDGKYLEFANVLLLSAKDSSLVRGAISEENGAYVFENISMGEYLIETSLVGFGNGQSSLINFDGKTDFSVNEIQLENGIEIDEITVVGKKPFVELRADKMIVNVANSSVNVGNSALEVLAKSPGVTIDNNNNISLRGKQGVLVTINGKNQYLSGDEISRLLETMPSSNIETIEIITNPSAKYDAEGNSGIINIVLKKNENLGTNGNISTTLRQGINTSHFHNIGLNNRSEKLNIYGNAEYYDWGWSQDLGLLRNINYLEGVTVFDQNSEMREVGNGYNVKLGMDWSLAENSTLGFLVKRNEGGEQNYNDNITTITGDNMPEFERLVVDADGDKDYMSNTYNVNFTQKLSEKGMKLTLDADYSDYLNEQDFVYGNFFRDNNDIAVLDPYFLRNNQKIDIDIFATTADLEIPISETVNIETGLKLSLVSTESNTKFESLNMDDVWVLEPLRTNDFIYNEDVYAGYVNGSFSFLNIMFQAGLRLEHTESKGVSMTTGSDVPRSYTNIFPSLSMSKQFGERHNVSLSFSRRLERPNYKKLNPFVDYLDQYTFQKGNPFLNPQYSNSIGLNYALGNSLFIAANYSHTTDAISDILEQNSATNTTFQTNDNLDNTHSASLTISAPKVWAEWWTSRLNATGFYNDFVSVLNDGSNLDNKSFGAQVSFNNEIQLPAGINMEVSGSYQSKLVYGQLTIEPQGRLDFGFSKRLFDGKGNIKLSASDVLLTSNSKVYIDQNDVNLFVNQVNDTRRVSLNFTYNFGNQKVKGARKRKTSSSDESNRI
ncbi:outer membrane beta-barrel protein [bacterium]|nr:outer membrane beta-barrel protein [bacterium]